MYPLKIMLMGGVCTCVHMYVQTLAFYCSCFCFCFLFSLSSDGALIALLRRGFGQQEHIPLLAGLDCVEFRTAHMFVMAIFAILYV